MEQMQAQAEHVGAQMMWDQIVEIDLSRRPFRLIGDGGTVYSGDVLVIATGAQARWLEIPVLKSISRAGASPPARPATASSIAARRSAVIGGGNTAVEEALYLTNHSHDVP
jgi:thioredoxin reductase (NADPH)